MTMRYYDVIITFAFIMLVSATGKAGSNHVVFPKDSVSSDFSERICLFTDRNIYTAGEKLLFSAFISGSPSSWEYDWSRVMYLELISSNGNPVVQSKHPLSGFKADGSMQLPENLFTGNYYLKAYTRWMRNFSASGYTWVQVKVINPFQAGIENAAESAGVKDEIDFIAPGRNLRKNAIICQTDKTIYYRRDKVVLDLTIPPEQYDLPEYYCVTVIRPGATDTLHYGPDIPSPDKNIRNYPLNFIPDIRGLSLSGRIVDKSTGLGVRQVHVRLSVLGENSDYSSCMTHHDGSFIFALQPYHGTTDMYITAESREDISMEILVDKEYANDNPVSFGQSFRLSKKEKETAAELMLHYQIEKAYREDIRDTSTGTDSRIRSYFYGQPSNTIYIDDYIELPTIGEVIFELVPDVSVIKRSGLYYLRSGGYIIDLEVYRPLIFIDNIPVADVGRMLNMSPERIERIDVVDRIYAKGNMLFGGIMNLVSRKGDMAGIDLPENSYFFDYDGFAQTDAMASSGMMNQDTDSRVPDVRNCLYWNPAVKIIPGSHTKLEFYTSDKSGNYTIVIRGVTREGIVLEGHTGLRVVGSGNPGIP
jgi:hypothetical protein